MQVSKKSIDSAQKSLKKPKLEKTDLESIDESLLSERSKEWLIAFKGYVADSKKGEPVLLIDSFSERLPYNEKELVKVMAIIERCPSYEELIKKNITPKVLHLVLHCGVADNFEVEQKFQLWKRLAKNKNRAAMLTLAHNYLKGHYLCEKNCKKAIKWFERAAKLPKDAGITYATLGNIFLFGNGVESDRKKARDYFEKALEIGLIVELRDELGGFQGKLYEIEDLDKY